MRLLVQLLANAMVNGAIYAVLACAFGLVYRTVRVFHIAFAGLFLIGPYTGYAASRWLHVPIWLALMIGMAAAGLASLAMERFLYWKFWKRNASVGPTMVASLGLFIVIENGLSLLFGNEVFTFDRGLASRVDFGLASLTSVQITQLAVCLACLALLVCAARFMSAFRVIWSLGDEPELVPALGLSLKRYRAVAFVVSGVLAGLAGGLIGADVGMHPHMGMSFLMIGTVAVLTGGMDRLGGWMLGGFLLAVLQSIIVWKLSAKWMDLATSTVLVGILLLRPQGIMGYHRRLEEAAA